MLLTDVLIGRAQPKNIPGIPSPVQAYLERLHGRHAFLRDGDVATYIPELGKADPEWFGICLATTDGRLYEVGDTRQPFTIQSISKPLTYGLALGDRGRETVLGKVGVEPSGEAFNSISLAPETGRPLNPMINAGAIATASLVAGHSAEDRLARLLAVFSLYAGRPLAIDDAVYRSEKATGHRNRAIAHMLRNFDILTTEPDEALDLYFRQCSVLVDCRDLATIAATMANGGTNPLTGQRAVAHELVDSILSVMTSCGMYDFAGEWLYAVGMPAKSGVAGGILAVLPGQLGLGVFSPRLDSRGNSVRGVAVCRDVARELDLHFLRTPRLARATIRAEHDLGDVRSRRLRNATERAVLDAAGARVRVYRLQGDLSFAALEAVVRRIVEATPGVDLVVLDLERVTLLETCALPLASALLRDLRGVKKELVLVGVQHHGTFVRALEESAASHETGPVRVFSDLDSALEWCEGRLLAEAGHRDRVSVTLAQHDLCRGLGPDALPVLGRLLHPRHFARGELIVREGDAAEEMFLLMSGTVSVTTDIAGGARRRLSTLSPGMVFGELTIVDRAPRTADVRADTPVECLVLPAAELDRLGRQEPAIKVTILENLLRSAHDVVGRLGRQLTAIAG
jgi:glutaminase